MIFKKKLIFQSFYTLCENYFIKLFTFKVVKRLIKRHTHTRFLPARHLDTIAILSVYRHLKI